MAEIFLWAGLNYESISLDEVNGGGLNQPVDMLMLRTDQIFRPLIESEDVWAHTDGPMQFEQREIETIREHRLATVRREDRILEVGDR